MLPPRRNPKDQEEDSNECFLDLFDCKLHNNSISFQIQILFLHLNLHNGHLSTDLYGSDWSEGFPMNKVLTVVLASGQITY